jgi:hypothetical protein
MKRENTHKICGAVLFGFTLLFSAHAAHSAESLIKRSTLIRACTGKTPAEINDCSGYIAGVADLAADPPPGAKAEVCFTGPVTLKILRESVTLYLQGHPAPDGPAVPSVYEALKTLYKC